MEHGCRPRILTGRNISVALKDFPNDFGKCNSKKRKRNNNSNDGVDDDDDDAANDGANDQDELSRWKKRSIFFDLPYWEVSDYVLNAFFLLN